MQLLYIPSKNDELPQAKGRSVYLFRMLTDSVHNVTNHKLRVVHRNSIMSRKVPLTSHCSCNYRHHPQLLPPPADIAGGEYVKVN